MRNGVAVPTLAKTLKDGSVAFPARAASKSCALRSASRSLLPRSPVILNLAWPIFLTVNHIIAIAAHARAMEASSRMRGREDFRGERKALNGPLLIEERVLAAPECQSLRRSHHAVERGHALRAHQGQNRSHFRVRDFGLSALYANRK